MPSSRIVPLVLLLLATVTSGLSAGESRSTRVFYLKDMGTREAITLLRSEVQVRQIAEIRELHAVVVTETEERITRSETLLRERDGLERAVAPHDPLRFERGSEEQTETRVFRLAGIDPRSAQTVLRSLYQIRELTVLADGTRLSVRTTIPKLEASEALFRELGVLEVADRPSPIDPALQFVEPVEHEDQL